MFSGFPTSPPTGASWLSSTWKLEMPISSINLFGLFWTRVDLRGPSKLCVGNMSVVRVGIDGWIRQRFFCEPGPTKSLNISPSCCTRDLKARRSTDSLICPLTYVSMAVIISLALSFALCQPQVLYDG